MKVYRLELGESAGTSSRSIIELVLRTPKQMVHPTTGEVVSLGIPTDEVKVRARMLTSLAQASDVWVLSEDEAARLREWVQGMRWAAVFPGLVECLAAIEAMTPVDVQVS